MITTRGLARTFTSRSRSGRTTVEAVRGVDIDVAEGELIGFLGPNGAGKTTTLRMLTTLLTPTAGEATVAGCDLRTDPLGVRKRIGYVSQSGGATAEAKVGEELVLQGQFYRMPAARARARAAELVEQLDLRGLDDRRCRTLSGGQRRRLDIAMGLIHEPKLVFLDEPSTGLDPQSRANLWDHIRKLRNEQGATVFLTTHYLDEADALSDRIIVIDNGAIVAEGTQDELKSRVAGDAVRFTVDTEHAARAATIAERLNGARELSTADGEVFLRVPRGDTAMPELLRALDAEHITMTAMSVQRPTLDDVFLTFTGRSLREAEAPDTETTKEHADVA
ncbi:daunorubicin resistance protein DrrA family ABC transporter ATP-binding protein [Sciscionella marina]|uniref:daunorubicin resistance protein DrrA family ABC transporter ATP-binding protein n=1 Tax=Sciscionella marina TaxID=508770 RepID=UPI000370B711|nr:daunorubicin resistance protein DrrA family ABC transporter ATP-binding protein [Sciscionella marina]